MTTSLSFYSNIFGFVAGGVSLLGLVVAVCRSQLPSNKIKTLEDLLHDTENIFKEAVEDGLLGPEFARMTEHRLTALKDRAYSLRSRAHSATSLFKDYVEFLSGTSTAIGSTCQSLRKLKAEVISSSEERRSRSNETIPASNINATSPPSVLRHVPLAQCPPNLFLSNQLPRPCSCPPAFPAWKSDGAAGGRPRGNPICGPTQSDADVRTTDVQDCTSIVHTPVTLNPRV